MVAVRKEPQNRPRYKSLPERDMLPARKVSKARKRKRRAHNALSRPNLVACPKCGVAKLPHASCENCGYVSGKVALATKEEES